MMSEGFRQLRKHKSLVPLSIKQPWQCPMPKGPLLFHLQSWRLVVGWPRGIISSAQRAHAATKLRVSCSLHLTL